MSKIQYTCLICNTSYSSKYSLQTHEQNIHKNVKFTCQSCGKQYEQKRGLRGHINSKHKGITHYVKKNF